MLHITSHPAFAAHVSARRGPLDFAPPLGPLRESEVWRAFAGLEKSYWFGRVKNDEHARRATATCNAQNLDDLRALAVAERLMWRSVDGKPASTLVELVAAKRDLSSMVEMKLDSSTIAVVEKEGRLGFDEGDPVGHDASWTRARAVVSRADDASYEKAREVAAKWRASRPVMARVLADYLFPEETAWANADLDEMAPLLATTNNVWHRAQLLLTVTDSVARVTPVLDVMSEWALGAFFGSHVCDLAVSLAPADAFDVLCKLLARGKHAGKQQLAVLGAAMCALEGEEMAVELAGLLLHSPIGPLAVDYFKRFPDLARAVLPKVAAGTSKAADAAKSILSASANKDDVPLADASEVPRLLRETPWRNRKKTKPVALAIELPMPKTTIAWKEGEKASALASTHNWYRGDIAEMSAEVLEQWERLARERRPVDVWVRWGHERGNFRVPERAALKEWNENPTALTYLGPLRMLAVHGEPATPGLFAREAFVTSWNAESLFDAQLHAIGKESAAIAAHALARRKAWKKRAQDWIGENAGVVAQALLPVALGKDSRERKEAEAALRVAARANRTAVEDAARALGGDAERAAMELVDRDPLTDLDVKGKLPPFLRVEDLPVLVTKSGKRVPGDAVAALLEILRSTSPDSPYVGLDEIREGLDAASLGELAWALVQTWILAGAKGTYEWIPHALAFIGDDGCARRLAPYVRDWARKDAKKASMAVDVLAAMGSPPALLHLSYVADKSRFEEAKKHARETLERVAGAQGLTTDELADRTVPDLELDEGGTTTLDFGPRNFTVTFDEGLRPAIKGEDGTRLAPFPRGTKTDDAALVKAASARFKAIRADAESVAQSLLRRFEGAMVRGRTWSAESFRAYVVRHPLVTHIARRLVWSASSGPFRVAEDGSLADAKDAEYTLSADAQITLPHPLVLGSDLVAAWSRIFSDYGIVQPFEQLGRATFPPAPLDRFVGRKSKAGPLIGSLDSRGWQKWADETSLSSAGKILRTKSGGEANVTLSFSPGIELGDIANSPEQTFLAPVLRGAASYDDVHPIDYSELVRDLEALAH